jgi:hypothetical protein
MFEDKILGQSDFSDFIPSAHTSKTMIREEFATNAAVPSVRNHERHTIPVPLRRFLIPDSSHLLASSNDIACLVILVRAVGGQHLIARNATDPRN